MGVDQWILPALVLWPLLAAVGVRILGRDASQEELEAAAPNDGLDARLLTVLALAVEAVLSLALWGVAGGQTPGWQARFDMAWLVDLGATISMGVDGISLPMVVLTGVLLPLTMLATWSNVRTRTPAYGTLVLVLTSGIMGVLVSLDLLLFYLMWELMLVPTYFMIGIWGTGNAIRASIRYVLFTLVGSLLMLVAMLALWNAGGASSFHIDHLSQVLLTPQVQLWMFAAFFLAFAVKSALVPFHTWLPDAQSSAPTFVAVTLGLKVGVYAILRFAIPLFPAAATHPVVRNAIVITAVVAIVYGAFVAMAQRDLKRLISYSSISHLGFIMLGTFVLTQQSVQGAVMIMINHGITTSALFLLVGMLYDREGRTDIGAFGGLARAMPAFSIMMTLAILSTVGLPGTNGFVGEFLVLIGSYGEEPVLTVIATSGVIFAAVYGMRVLGGVVLGPTTPTETSGRTDLTRRELAIVGVFAVAIVWLGVAPNRLLNSLEPATRGVIEAARFGPNATASVVPPATSR